MVAHVDRADLIATPTPGSRDEARARTSLRPSSLPHGATKSPSPQARLFGRVVELLGWYLPGCRDFGGNSWFPGRPPGKQPSIGDGRRYVLAVA